MSRCPVCSLVTVLTYKIEINSEGNREIGRPKHRCYMEGITKIDIGCGSRGCDWILWSYRF
jgi:hypothetical protein